MSTMTIPGWPALVVALCMLGSYAIRKFTPNIRWLHEPFGAFLVALASALLTSFAQAIPARGLSTSTLIAAAIGAITSAVASANPSGAASSSILRALLPLAILGSLAGGCATGQSPLTSTYQTAAGAVQGLGVTLKAAESGDAIYQATVATDATLTAPQKRVKLAAYRAARAQQGLPVVHQVQGIVDAGPPILQLAVDGVKKQADVDAWIVDALAAAKQLGAALTLFGVGAPAVRASLDGAQIAAIVTSSLTGAASLAGGIVGIVAAVRSMGSATPDAQASSFAAAVQAFDALVADLPRQLAANDAAADALVK